MIFSASPIGTTASSSKGSGKMGLWTIGSAGG